VLSGCQRIGGLLANGVGHEQRLGPSGAVLPPCAGRSSDRARLCITTFRHHVGCPGVGGGTSRRRHRRPGRGRPRQSGRSRPVRTACTRAAAMPGGPQDRRQRAVGPQRLLRRPDAGGSTGRVRPGGPGFGLPPGHHRRQWSDGRGGRCLRQPVGRGGPCRLPRPVRPARLHHRQRLLPQGEPGRFPVSPARRQLRLGRRGRARPRHGLGGVPAVRHPAGRSHQQLHQRPRNRGRHRRRPGREVRVQQLWRR
jgi:hypothetical protein